ncbi:hypothetical protein [Natrinema sp. SYSU A 869]|uniref:hypothetical protein n=1 Tax=Natrinema sp. SYSU A 869 TaxID=2871694 RepID=UPI001CA3B7E5|nr:hypothetical protein [Natrinema sp. SYSU A 869]
MTNATDRERRVSLAASVDGATLSPSERTTAVKASETVLVDFPVESVRSEGERTVELSVDGATVEEAMIDLDDAASGGIAVETDLEAATIDHGVATLAVTVENVGGVALEDVRLLETDSGTDALEPGEEWTETVTRPYEPDRRVSVGLEVARGARRREYAPTCTLPPAPTIDVEPDGDAVRATIETDGSATVADRLVIELPGAGRVRTDVTLERDEFLLVVPQFDDGTARIGFESIDVDERVRLSGSGPGTHSRSSGIGDTRSSGASRDDSARTDPDRTEPDRVHDDSESIGTDSLEPTNADRSVRSETNAESPASAADSGAADDDSGPSTDESIAAADRSATGTPVSDDRSTAESTVDDFGSATEPPGSEFETATEPPVGDTDIADDHPSSDRSTREPAAGDGSAAEPRIAATRRIADETAPIGHAVRDRIDLENEGQSAVAVSVDVGESTVDVGRLEAGERTTLERTVAVLSGGETTLSPVAVTADGAVRADCSGRTIAVSGDGVAVRATVDPNDGSVVAELENCDDRPYRIRGLEAAGHTVALDARLAPGESATATGSPDRWTDPNADALEGSLVVADEDGSERRVNIVATVSSVAADSNDGDDPFEIAIGPETQVAGEYGTVVLVFENGGDRPVSDVAVSASGEPINELFYSEARRERLAVGDRIEHFVDIEPDVTDPSFDATVAYTLEDAAREYTVRTAGPSAEDETAWTEQHRERWSVERVEDASTDPNVLSSLSTPFRLE